MATILIVEDEEALSEALSDKLIREGHKTYIENTGLNILKIIKNKNFDLILLDLIMPKRTGLEVLEDLKNDPEVRKTPVIVLSGLSDDETIKKALRLGAVDYFVKANHPISEVVEKVKVYLSKPK